MVAMSSAEPHEDRYRPLKRSHTRVDGKAMMAPRTARRKGLESPLGNQAAQAGTDSGSNKSSSAYMAVKIAWLYKPTQVTRPFATL